MKAETQYLCEVLRVLTKNSHLSFFALQSCDNLELLFRRILIIISFLKIDPFFYISCLQSFTETFKYLNKYYIIVNTCKQQKKIKVKKMKKNKDVMSEKEIQREVRFHKHFLDWDEKEIRTFVENISVEDQKRIDLSNGW